MLWLISVVTVMGVVTGQQPPPCQKPIFSYVERRGERVGSIRLADPGGRVALDVLLYTAAQLSTTQNERGGVDYFSPTKPTSTLRFFVRLPSQHPVSQVRRITVNGEALCQNEAPQGARMISTSLYSFILSRPGNSVGNPVRLTQQTLLVTRPPTSAPVTDEDVCGIPVAPQILMFNGNLTRRGDWPWIAALMLRNMQFTCGTTIIGKRHVITAAHCLFHPDTDRQLKADDLVVGLGKFNLTKWDERDVQFGQVERIIINEEFNKPTLINDIAILQLDEDIVYTVYVRPICLWGMNTDLEEIVGRSGIVVGWGLTEAFQISSTPLLTKQPIVSQQVCSESHPTFRANMTLEHSFCAGTRMGVGPCKGDSGSGLVIQARDARSRSRWFLRGVVSFNAPGNSSVCHLDGFSLFTDVAKYQMWIQASMKIK